MSSKIKILSQDVINKIAAGEVVERPASVVKELIENSLDAGATQVVVEVKNAGKKLIRVADNGCGMSKEGALLAFERHSTSKITTAEDLINIGSYGFRGEALPSIAAVSRLVLTTRPADEICGTVIEVEGGVIKKAKEYGCSAGTTLIVNDLFFNTPARLKFTKNNATETGHISDNVVEQALANNEIGFKLISNDRQLINIPPAKSSSESDLLERITYIFGKDLAQNLLNIKFENKLLKIRGFISQPVINRVNKSQQFIFVNKRSIRSRLVTHAIYQGYHGFLFGDRHPIIFLFIDIDPFLIDVNVHPSKREIRFTNEQGIHELVSRVVKQRLTSEQVIPQIKKPLDIQKPTIYPNENENRNASIKEVMGEYLSKTNIKTGKRFNIHQNGTNLFERTQFVFNPQEKESEEEITILDITPLAQLDNLYILAKDFRGLLIIDQHAANERVLYEKFKKDYQGSQIKFQDLLFPITIELSPKQEPMVSENLENLSKLGFGIEKFGFNTFIVKTVPVLLGENYDKKVILDIFDVLSESETSIEPADISTMTKNLSEEMLKIMACHSAIKAGDKLNIEECYSLLEELGEVSLPYTCPHGRPTMIRITFDELEKKFKRK